MHKLGRIRDYLTVPDRPRFGRPELSESAGFASDDLSRSGLKHRDPSRDVMRWVWQDVSGERITLSGTGFDDYSSQILPIHKLRVKGVQSVVATLRRLLCYRLRNRRQLV